MQRVLYLGLASHPDHQVAERLLKKGCSGMLSFEIEGNLEDGIKVVEVSEYSQAINVGDDICCFRI